MKTIIFLLTFLSLSATAQNFQGYAIYESKTAFEIEMDSTKIPKEQMNMMKAMMKKLGEKSFRLSFDKSQSIFKEEEKLDKPSHGGGVKIMGSFNSGIYYKNIKEKRITNQKENFSKLFLIQDALPDYQWKLKDETKMIGEHLCFKATTTKEVRNRRMRRPRKSDKKETGSLPKTKTIEVTAWYTPDIPVNNGPKEYAGLPGLILEVQEGKTSLLCTKIVINPKDKITLKEPTKGKKVNQEKFDEISEKKEKEMMEMYGGGRKKDGGNSHLIRIGG